MSVWMGASPRPPNMPERPSYPAYHHHLRPFLAWLRATATRGALPVGKGMWIWQPEHTENGDVAAIVTRATTVGLTHLFVRTGSTFDGFYAQRFLDQLLPPAHAAGIRVYGWDVPYLDNDD